jgi:hypothetical protein
MKFGAKKTQLCSQGVTFRAKFHSKSLYGVEKKIVGISQYAYFSAHSIKMQQLKNYICCMTLCNSEKAFFTPFGQYCHAGLGLALLFLLYATLLDAT